MNVLPLETNGADLPPSPLSETIIDAPSGFILKLFQMITDADDDLVKWTSKGDAFIIGCNIKRLEAETLPLHFRHNRFQSLVRQLNFYSFRKMNKERNVWIYKHELFHRDRPEDLYKVRRRTCPGLDGRKQRFNRYSTSRLNGEGSEDSSDDLSVADENAQNTSAKRFIDDVPALVLNKRPRRLSNDSEPINGHVETLMVDRSLVTEETLPKESTGAGDIASGSSDVLTVSEVSDRLEEYARKARSLSGGRSAQRSGIVTPPYDPTSVGLVTYDDECNYDSDDHLSAGADIPPLRLSLASDDGVSFADEETQYEEVVPPETWKLRTPAVKDSSQAGFMVNQILERVPHDRRDEFLVLTTAAGFCMSTSPTEDGDLCTRLLHLMAACDELSNEFQVYRSALNPCGNVMTMERLLQLDAGRGVAVREFKTFAVNCMQTLLESEYVYSDETSIFELTVDLWSKKVGVVA